MSAITREITINRLTSRPSTVSEQEEMVLMGNPLEWETAKLAFLHLICEDIVVELEMSTGVRHRRDAFSEVCNS